MQIGGVTSAISLYHARRNQSNAESSTTLVPSASPASPVPAVTCELSAKATDLLNRRSVSDLDKKQLQSLLSRAVAENAQADPKTFLASLSPTELDLVRRAHCLADRIDVETLSYEGAYNLLVEPGAGQDLDNNGLTRIGIGNTIAFPPRNAPESFKAAWAKATESQESLMDTPMHLPFMIGLANLHVAADGSVTSIAPDDPRWRNPFAAEDFDYAGKIDEIVSSIKYQYSRGQVSDQIFKRDMRFYSILTQEMQNNAA